MVFVCFFLFVTYVVLAVIETILTITGRYICSANNLCDNNGEVCVQC